jgi:poly-gamma-glutamate synthesis protein (capsule biosynthesis protein)
VLANNHVLDYGIAGLLETLESLRRCGITASGAGQSAAAAAAPAVLNLAGGGRVLVFAFGAPDCGIPPHWAARPRMPGINLLDDLGERSVLRLAELVTSTKLPNDLAILSIHWGGNWGSDIPIAHRRFAHGVIDDAKIDLVHGHSSHHPKAIEIYNGHPIFYGCGDFLDDYEGIAGYELYRDDLVLMYFPTMDVPTGELKELLLTPLQIRQFRLQRPSGADRAWLRTNLEVQCRRFGHCIVDRDGAWVLR